MTIKIINFGCLMNGHENNRIKEYLTKNNYIINEDKFDAIIVSCCAVTSKNEEIIKKFTIENYNKKIYFFGCISKTLREFILKNNFEIGDSYNCIEKFFPPVNKSYSDITYSGNYEITNIPDYLEKTINSYYTFCNYFEKINKGLASAIANGLTGFEFRYQDKEIYKVKVSSGCSHSCNYCIIPKIKGFIKSRLIEEILLDIEVGHKKGFKKFLLLADDLASYGIDNYKEYSINKLLKEIKNKFSDVKIGLRYLEPMTLPKIWNSIKEFINDSFIFSLNIPIQSGSQTILEKVNRNMNVAQLKIILQDMRTYYTGPILTHVIVGFHFESEIDIDQTMELLNFFDNTSIHIFSPRVSTKFYNLKNHPNTALHENKILNYKKYMFAKYLHRIFTTYIKTSKNIYRNEYEYRYPLTTKLKKEIDDTFEKTEWSKPISQTDIVFMNNSFPGFVIRLRHVERWNIQIKIKKSEFEWQEISLPIMHQDLNSLYEFLEIFMEPKSVISKKRIFSKILNFNINLCLDDVKYLGAFVEFEATDNIVNKIIFDLGLSVEDACPPYGRMLDDLNLDVEKEIQEAIKDIK